MQRVPELYIEVNELQKKMECGCELAFALPPGTSFFMCKAHKLLPEYRQMIMDLIDLAEAKKDSRGIVHAAYALLSDGQ